MEKFEEMNRKRKVSNARFAKLNSKVYKLFLEMGDATYCDGAISKKINESSESLNNVIKNLTQEWSMQLFIDTQAKLKAKGYAKQ